ncbi:transaldolase [Hahella sp. NBU794]|uniref:transaldolase n=1 Tax=Hahella sp. NBU794 TaxID=3422590 RepID=UPI003D6F89EF
MKSLLNQLRDYTKVVADTGDLEAIRRFAPEDATTNPSLVLKAVQSGDYDALLRQSVALARRLNPQDEERAIETAQDNLVVAMAQRILDATPGKVSIEVSARYSYDIDATVTKARELRRLLSQVGAPVERVLIKIAATWEGAQAARILEREGVNCNLTLIFNLAQARACAEAGAFLVSPFVGRILDWYKRANPDMEYVPEQEPGVLSVKDIYRYYRRYGYATIVMGASFRNIGEIIALAGCDRLTISPSLLEALADTQGTLLPALCDDGVRAAPPEPLTEKEFRWLMSEDAMATEKLAEGIRGFYQDQLKLEAMIRERLRAGD